MSSHQGTEFSRQRAPVELFATVGLAMSTLVAATVVSIGIARADVLAIRADSDTTPLAVAFFLGLFFLATGGLTVMMAKSRSKRR
jgi:hypothetical protein